MIMVCCLDNESYSSPIIIFCSDEDEARKYIKNLCEEEGYSIKWEEDNRCYADKIGDDFGVEDDHYWCVFKYFEVTGDYILLYYHAYDGVDFEIVGNYETYHKARDAMIMDTFDHYSDCQEDQRIFEWLDQETACIDNGNEWEVWRIVKVSTEVEV